MQHIRIRGARTHNLKNIDLDLPRDQLIVITGLSGSGKSSLAFDTLFAEGQRRYVESLSAYARQFLSVMEKPDVDLIEGLSPAIAIEQKSASHNPRSTVGTVTEIYDYLRLLFARVGEPRCPKHGEVLCAQTITQMVDQIMALPEETAILLLAPVVKNRKGEYIQLLKNLQSQGFVRVRVNGVVHELDEVPSLDRHKKHVIEVVVDRLRVRPGQAERLAESLEVVETLGEGLVIVSALDGDFADKVFSSRFACRTCGYSLSEMEPRLFSFNSPAGACTTCDGLGMIEGLDPAQVVQDEALSLPGGAVRGWDRRNRYCYRLLTDLAKHYQFDLDTPFADLPESVRRVVLYGSGTQKISFRYVKANGKSVRRHHPFEGIIPNMERHYREDRSPTHEDLTRYISRTACTSCHGARLNQSARHVFVQDTALPELCAMQVDAASVFLGQLTFDGQRSQIAEQILKEVLSRLSFLLHVGLDYLTLDRSANTLSGGEAQRIRLASQIGAGLVGVVYVLDEPTIGLHQSDNARLLNALCKLRDLGNSVIMVEHDSEAIQTADYVVDIGPGAGVHGGEVVATGTPEEIAQCHTLTGDYLAKRRQIETPAQRIAFDKKRMIQIKGITGNNLKNIDVDIPIGLMTCVTGMSGSGKSTLINDTLFPLLSRKLHQSKMAVSPYRECSGLDPIQQIIDVDQSPIGRTPRSNPATYTGLFTPIRDLFAATEEARVRGYRVGRFSFNVKGGRCEPCEGEGEVKVAMHFLPDVYVRCDSCHGKRYNRETLEVLYKGKNIHQILKMTVEEACEFFAPIPAIARRLSTLMDVGLSYIKLGQSAVTLSGGEAQRIKLSRELSKRDTGNSLYILDEPTTGLHFHDVKKLLEVLHRLRDHGNTIVVIEHNLDVIKTADWVIDLGPKGGSGGGYIVATGTPENVARNRDSTTGIFLKKILPPATSTLSQKS